MNKADIQELKLFGLAFSIVFSVLCTKAVRGGNTRVFVSFLTAAVLFFALAISKPVVLYPLQKTLKAIAGFIGKAVSGLVLCAIFYLAITPIGLCARLFRKDFLGAGVTEGNLPSLWKKKTETFVRENYHKQF